MDYGYVCRTCDYEKTSEPGGQCDSCQVMIGDRDPKQREPSFVDVLRGKQEAAFQEMINSMKERLIEAAEHGQSFIDLSSGEARAIERSKKLQNIITMLGLVIVKASDRCPARICWPES